MPITFRISAISPLVCWVVLFTGNPAPAQTTKNTAPVDEKTRLNKALVDAASLGKLETVKELLKQGADIHYRDPTANGKTPLTRSVLAGQFEVVKYLLAKGGDQDLNRGPFPMLVSVCDHGQALPEFIPILIKAGINPDEFKGPVTALIAALQLDPKVRKPEVTRSYVKALIENKADVNLPDKKEKMTPLAWAKKRGDQEVIDMLVKAGAKE